MWMEMHSRIFACLQTSCSCNCSATMEIKIKPPTTTTTTTKFSFQFFLGVCSELNSSGCCCSYQFEIEIIELWLLFQKLNLREKSNDFSYKLTASGFWIFVWNLHYKFSYSWSNKDLKEQRFYETDPFTKLAHNWNVVVKLVCKWSVQIKSYSPGLFHFALTF